MTIPRIEDMEITVLAHHYTTASKRIGMFDSLIVHQTDTIYSGETLQRYARPILKQPAGSAVVAVNGPDAICVAQYRPALQRIVIEIPGGRRSAEEDELATARREFQEETGLGARNLSLLFRCSPAPCSSDLEASIFLATDLYPLNQPPSPDLPTIPCLLRMADIEKLVAEGVLVDAKTIAGLLVARGSIG
jgi:ADP-ribose pyrophosphatase